MIDEQRIAPLNDRPVRSGAYVLYWMQASQREHYNHALEYGAGQANRLGLPLLCVFGLTDDYPEANARHYAFLLEGLAEVAEDLAGRGVRLAVHKGRPDRVALDMADEAALVVTDCGYTRIQRKWRQNVADGAPCLVVEVESDVVVPADVASDKEEYAAATIRKKLHRQRDRFLRPLRRTPLKRDSLGLDAGGVDVSDPHKLLAELKIDRGAWPVSAFRGGARQAHRLLDAFLRDKLSAYAERRNDPSLDIQSHMSPYLHFGQISPVWIALKARRAGGRCPEAREAYLEELIVRRELSVNFVHQNPRYDEYACLPDWARKTLAGHARDKRPHVYSPEQLEAAETHDEYWNAAMREMRLTGKMHNYMRMYWGKKILEWSESPEQAYRTTLSLNNRWFLDGRDANSFAGVAWCFGKHDRPWTTRPVFGSVRYMNAAGLERKFDMDGYLRKVDAMAGAARRE